MTTLTEGNHRGEFIASEANGSRSREAVTFAMVADTTHQAGTIMGKVFAGTATAQADAGNTGNGAMGAITVSGAAKVGTYRLTIIEPATDAGAFEVEDPDGVSVGVGAVAAAFSAGGLAFTLADGATDFVAGDAFDIVVVETSASAYVQFDPAGTDGSQRAAGIAYDTVVVSAAAQSAVIINRDAEVNDHDLVYPTVTQAQKDAVINDLLALGIRVLSEQAVV